MRLHRWVMVLGLVGLLASSAVVLAEATPPAPADETKAGAAAKPAGEDISKTIALAAAVAFVTAVSIVGSAIAVGRIGAAALGAAAEKPELLTRSLLFVALAEGLAVLGFVVAMILVSRM